MEFGRRFSWLLCKKIAVKLLSKLDIFNYQVTQILELFSKVVTPMLV